MKKENLISFMRQVSQGLEDSGKLGTAHVYKSTLNVVVAFLRKDCLPFRAVTPGWLKCFENSLRGRDAVGIRCLPICVRCVPSSTVP